MVRTKTTKPLTNIFMTKTNLTINSGKGYQKPCVELAERGLEELLCDSPDGFTEDIGEIDDFTW